MSRSAWQRAIVRGPGIPAVLGECEVSLSVTGLIAHEDLLADGRWWHAPLHDVQ